MRVSFRQSSKQENPQADKGLQVNYEKAKRGGYTWRWYLLLGSIVLPALLASWILLKPAVFVLAPGYITTEPLELKAYLGGLVTRIYVKRGQQVKAGDFLVQLSDPSVDMQITIIESELELLQEDEYNNDEKILATARRRINAAEEGLQRQENFLKTFEAFSDKGVVPTADMAAVVQAYTNARMMVEQARVDFLSEQQRQTVTHKAGPVRSRHHQLLYQMAELKDRQQSLIIKAPYASKVVDINVQLGGEVSQNQSLLWLSGRTKPVVIAYLEPRHLDYVSIGQTATIKFPNGHDFQGEIVEPTELVAKVPDQLVGPFEGEKPALKVILQVEDLDGQWVEGLPVEVVFDRF